MTLKVEQNPKRLWQRDDMRRHDKAREDMTRHEKARQGTRRHGKARGHGMFPTHISDSIFTPLCKSYAV